LQNTLTLDSILVETQPVGEKKKFGTFMGAYMPSFLMLFGVVVFLRLGWIVGNAGLYTSLLIISLVTFIILLTILSLSAAATNIKVGKGGTYYMVSRALGIEMGSAVGLSLYLKQSISTAFCTIGFAESFHGLFPQFSVQAIGLATLAGLAVLSYFSTNFVLKIQIFLFGIIGASLYSLFSGGNVVSEVITEVPASPLSFWGLFALFFPAMTGLESSLSMSGDLKNPSRSLPVGVLTAVLTAYVSYMAIAFFLWSTVPQTLLIEDKLIIQHIAKYESLIILGIWGATLSSAIGAMLGAPRTLQALAEDGIVPSFLGKEFGPTREPRIASLLTLVIAFFGITLGSINVIAPVLAMICLISYGILNLATGLEDLMGNPSWRPTFPVHWSISFLGAALCLLAMLMINAGAAIIALTGIASIYWFFSRKKMDASWEDIRYGILLFFSRFALYRLAWQGATSRSWRPNFLVFTGKPCEISNDLLKFTAAITQTKGFLTVASMLPKEEGFNKVHALKKSMKALFKKHRIEAFVCVHETGNILQEMQRIILHYGLGPLTPNTIVCGGISNVANLPDYLETILLAHERGRNVVVINDEPQKGLAATLPKAGAKEEVHVWWYEENPRNTELMLVLAYMLRKQSGGRKSAIYLVGVAPNEAQRLKMLDVFEELVEKNRLKIGTKVHLASHFNIELVRKNSLHASMIFLSLRPPVEGEPIEKYASYFQSLPHKSAEFPTVALVMCGRQTNLEGFVQIG